jgi:hypothetical protein
MEGPTTLTRIYQQADPDTMLRVVRLGKLRAAANNLPNTYSTPQ